MYLQGRYLTNKELTRAGLTQFGQNVKIHSRASIYGIENISIGNDVRIDDFAIIIATGPLVIGNYVSIHNYCYLASKYSIVLEDFVTLAPGVRIFTSSDDYLGEKLTGPVVPQEMTGGDHGKVILKKHVIVGANSVILPGCILGEGSSVGALSLVDTSLDSWCVYAGIPAKKIKKRKKNLLRFEEELKRTEVTH